MEIEEYRTRSMLRNMMMMKVHRSWSPLSRFVALRLALARTDNLPTYPDHIIHGCPREEREI